MNQQSGANIIEMLLNTIVRKISVTQSLNMSALCSCDSLCACWRGNVFVIFICLCRRMKECLKYCFFVGNTMISM